MNPQQMLVCLMAFIERDMLRAELAQMQAQAKPEED